VFPTLFAIAMDYLLIQPSAVPCERIFSSSTETDTKKRNCINPLLMEALQILKFHLKKERLNFIEGWAVIESQLIEDDPDGDLLYHLLSDSGYGAMENAIRSINEYDTN
jgi:hypothetical protein